MILRDRSSLDRLFVSKIERHSIIKCAKIFNPKRNLHCWPLGNAAIKSTSACDTIYKEGEMFKLSDKNSKQEYCIACARPFNKNPLSQKSRKRNICVGCTRLYGPCHNLEMLELLRYIQISRFGHGINCKRILYQQLASPNGDFIANKFRPHAQTNFKVYTELNTAQAVQTDYNTIMRLFHDDIWNNDRHLDLSQVLEERASNFLCHSKIRHRKLFPEAKISNEKFKFPTVSQLKGFMEASQGRCAWSGIRGFWKRQPNTNTMFLLSFDHKIPVSKLGSWNLDNLQIGLKMYNSVKGNESEMEIQRWLFH